MPRSNTALTTYVILPRTIATTQEIDVARIPNLEHPLLELIEIIATPSLIITHQFSSLRKLITIKTCCQCPIGITTYQLTTSCPCHQDTHGSRGISLGAFYFPTERILVSHRSTTCCIQVILTRSSTTNDSLYGICLGTRL